MRQTVRAPSIKDAVWLNCTPLGNDALRGKIVLLDFFTYCCMNCLNVLPDLKVLEEEFKNELLIIGVHSGKHLHEKENASIMDAIERYSIEHCVINDRDMRLWDAYGIRAWPTLVLIDPKGYIVVQYQGEGQLSALREDIKELLAEHTVNHTRFEIRERPVRTDILKYPQKIYCADEYLFISHSDEVLVCTYEGDVLHRIDDIAGAQSMLYIDKKLYVSSCTEGKVFEVSEEFQKRSVWLEGLRNPYGLETDGRFMYIGLAGSHEIKIYEISTRKERFSIGQENSESLNDGAFAEAVLAQPGGLSILEDELWFVDSESSSLRSAADGKVSSHIFNSDELQHPLDICVGKYGDGCGGGRVFIADSYNNRIKVYNPQTQEVLTLIEGLSEPSGICKKGCHLFIANTNAHEIVIFDLSKMHKSSLILKEAY